MARKQEPKSEQLKQRIRGAGLKVTGPRAAVLKVLEQSDAPVSHADVVAAVATIGATEHVDASTVYRNLVDLEGAGLVHRLDVGDHTWRYELKKEDDQHAHFVCGDCGVVECLPEGSVSVKGVPGRVGRVASVLLKGSCPDCG
jgi:Fur family ferric uptake transcriptional regulator